LDFAPESMPKSEQTSNQFVDTAFHKQAQAVFTEEELKAALEDDDEVGSASGSTFTFERQESGAQGSVDNEVVVEGDSSNLDFNVNKHLLNVLQDAVVSEEDVEPTGQRSTPAPTACTQQVATYAEESLRKPLRRKHL